jgi:hypothetical protein
MERKQMQETVSNAIREALKAEGITSLDQDHNRRLVRVLLRAVVRLFIDRNVPMHVLFGVCMEAINDEHRNPSAPLFPVSAAQPSAEAN